MGASCDLHGRPGGAQALRPHGRQGRDPGRTDGGEDQGRRRRAAAARTSSSSRAPTRGRARPRRGAPPRRAISEAGADGLFIEAPQTVKELERVGAHVQGRAADRQHAGRRRPDAGAAAERIEGAGLRHGGLSDHADFSRGAHHRAGAQRHQGRQAGRQRRRRELRRIQGPSPTTTNGRASRTTRARSGGRHEAPVEEDRTVRAAAYARRWRDRARTRRPRCGSRSAASSRCIYLPLTVIDRLGYFKDEGLDVEISDFAGGARALQALIGGSADVVTGAFDHTIQMQAKSQPITAVVQLGRFPGFVLGADRPEGRVLSRPGRSQGHEDRRHRAGLQHAFHGAAHDGAGRAEGGRRVLHRCRRRADGGGGGQARRDRRAGQRRSGDQPARKRERHQDRRRHPHAWKARRRFTAAPIRRPCCMSRRPTRRTIRRTVQSLANAFVRGLKWIASSFGRRDRQGDAARICARQHGAVRPLDPQQHADVFAGRPV